MSLSCAQTTAKFVVDRSAAVILQSLRENSSCLSSSAKTQVTGLVGGHRKSTVFQPVANTCVSSEVVAVEVDPTRRRAVVVFVV